MRKNKRIISFFVLFFIILAPAGEAYGVFNNIEYEYEIDALQRLGYISKSKLDYNKPLTKGDVAYLTSNFHVPHYLAFSVCDGEKVFLDVPEDLASYVEVSIANSYLKESENNRFGTSELVSFEEFLEIIIKAIFNKKVDNPIEFALEKFIISNKDLEIYKSQKDFLVRDALHIVYNAFHTIVDENTKKLWGEVLKEKAITKGPWWSYEKLVEQDWYKYNKDKIKIDDKNKAYEEGISPDYGAYNFGQRMYRIAADDTHVYYLTKDYKIKYERIKRKNLETGKIETIVDKDGIEKIVGIRDNLLYYIRHINKKYKDGYFTGKYDIEIRTYNIKTKEDKIIFKDHVNGESNDANWELIGNNYIYHFRRDKVYISKIGENKKKFIKKGAPSASRGALDKDDNLYFCDFKGSTSDPSTVYKMSPNGKRIKLGDFKYIEDMVVYGDWLYLSGNYASYISRMNLKTKKVEKLPDGQLLNIQYPWLYYAPKEDLGKTKRYKLDSKTPIIQDVHMYYGYIYDNYGLYLYKNYAYGTSDILDSNYTYRTVYGVYQIDLDTFETKEILDNRER